MTTPTLVFSTSAIQASVDRLNQMAGQYDCRWAAMLTDMVPLKLLQNIILPGTERASCSTVCDAEYLAAAGFNWILITSRIVDAESLQRLTKVAVATNIAVLIDHFRHAELLSQAAIMNGAVVEVLIEADLGQHSTGVSPGPDTASLAMAASRLPGLRVTGVFANADRSKETAASHHADEDVSTAITIAQHCLRSMRDPGPDCRELVLQFTPQRNGDWGFQPQSAEQTIERCARKPPSLDTNSRQPPEGSQRHNRVTCVVTSPFTADHDGDETSDLHGDEQPSVCLRATVISRPTLEWCVIDAGRIAFGESSILRIATPSGATVLHSTADSTTLSLLHESRDLRIGDTVQLIMSHPERLLRRGGLAVSQL